MIKRIVWALVCMMVTSNLIACGAYDVGAPTSSSSPSTKAITAFSFTSSAATGIINESAKTIAVTVPYGTDVTALAATFMTTGASVNVGSTVQVSGTTPNDFTNAVVYTVTGTDGTTTAYTVTVTIALNTTYSISGTVSGLTGTLILQDNGADDLSVSTNGAFTFATKIADGAAYNVTVKTQPLGQTCMANSNTGTIAGANVTNVSVVCTASIWIGTKQLGVAGAATYASGVAVDSIGNVYVTGYTFGGLDGNTLTGISDCFLIMYDSSGNKVRTKELGVAGVDTRATSVAVDSSGNVYVAGYTHGGLDGNTLTGTLDFFLTMYDSSGNKVRTKQLGVAGVATYATGVAVDLIGNVYVAGYTSGGLDGNALTGTSDFFLTMYDSSGNKVRTKQLGVAGVATYASGVAVDLSGNVYVVGYTFGGLDGNALTGMADFFLTMYDSSGNKVRTKQLGVAAAATYAYATGVVVDSNSNAYVTGFTDGGLDGNTITGTSDFFLTMYDSSGNKVRTRQLGVAGVDTRANSVAVDSSGNVYVAGQTSGGLDGNMLAGIFDFFLTTYDSLGNKVRTRQLGVMGAATTASGVAVDSSGNVYVAGDTSGGLDGNTLTGTGDIFVTKYYSTGKGVVAPH